MLRLGACLLCLPLLAVAVRSRVSVQATANPVRKVINLLQKMQKKIEQEGETEKELFDKFMCYCKTGAGDLSKSIAAAEDKIPMLETQLKAGSEAKVQSDDAAKEAKTDRADAKDAMAEATAVREKQAADFASLEAEYTANIGAIAKAVAALEKGMGEAFLQTDAAAALRSMLGQNAKDINDGDRDTVLSFLSSSEDSEYAPRSGEITGILKQMGDEMQSSLSDARAQEASAIKVYDELVAAKTEEVNALTKQIETKTQRSGELAVANAQMANDIEDSKEGLAQDKEFLAELQKSCGSKGKEWEDRVKVRQEETVALAETIKILNDDDALDLFKKTLPPPGDSLLQVKVSQAEVRARARKILLKAAHGAQHGSGVLAGFVAQALHGKKIGFDKVTVMIDKMIQTLMAEQKDDDGKKDYCGVELDQADDQKKATARAITDSTAAIEAAKEGIATAVQEIAALVASTRSLDQKVAEATQQRKDENAEYLDLISNDRAAKELLKMARNRLNKFYNPKLYQPPAKIERGAVDAIAEDVGGVALVQVASRDQDEVDEAPPPPPETFGAYQKNAQQSGGVIQMIHLLITDLEKDMVEAETEEKNAQTDYEDLMVEAAKKRAKDSKTLTGTEASKAEMETDLQAHAQAKKESARELAAVQKYILSLHAECDFLLKYYDVRKDMRAGEIDALGKAKAVLAGADYSLLQLGSSARPLLGRPRL
mmetsp:Transcript_105103/g.274380  ORF Transcript_105103/g.274380 Transcript_105103/m.274380 type:complete len:714 (-) Transcript_105103:84-2225(-)